jgi:hypothetical protein
MCSPTESHLRASPPSAHLTPEDVGAEVLEEMDREFHDSTDRVIAVVGDAYLDSMLDRVLAAHSSRRRATSSIYFARTAPSVPTGRGTGSLTASV